MKNPSIYLLSLASLFLFTGCFDHWTEQEKNAFAYHCSRIDAFNDIKVHFTGFDSVELSPLIVQEYLGTQLLDDFVLDVPMLKVPNEAIIERTMYRKHRYVFKLPGGQTFELANMKAVMGGHMSMFSEHYDCVMSSYTIDGVDAHGEYPTFVKKW